MRRVLAAISVAIAAAITFTTPTYAVQLPHSMRSAEAAATSTEAATTSRTAMEALSGARDTSTQWRSLDPANVRELMGKQQGALSSEALALDLAAAQAWEIDEHTRLLRIPIAPGQGVIGESSVNVFFDWSGAPSGKVEFYFVALTPDSGEVRTWLDGRMLVNEVVSAAETRETPTLSYKKGDWWGNFLLCMNSAGVAGWLVTAISIACGAICVVTAGAGCLVCLAAAAGTAGGTVGACIEIANRVS